MKTLPQVLEDYLTLRRAMGFKLSEAGDPTPACPTGGMGATPALGAGLCALPSCQRPPDRDPAPSAPAVPSATSCAVSLQ